MSETEFTYFYETVYVLSPAVSEGAVEDINKKVDSVVGRFEGEVKVRDDWGNKELAYPINRHTNGRMIIINYSGKPGVVEEIERHFKISNDVIRYMSVVVNADYKYSKIKKQITFSEEEHKKRSEARAEKKAFERNERDRYDRADFGDRNDRSEFDRAEHRTERKARS